MRKRILLIVALLTAFPVMLNAQQKKSEPSPATPWQTLQDRLQVRVVSIERAKEWKPEAFASMMEPVVPKGDGQLFVIKFDVKNIHTGKLDSDEGFEFELEDQDGKKHSAVFTRTDLRENAFVVPANSTPKTVRLTGGTNDHSITLSFDIQPLMKAPRL